MPSIITTLEQEEFWYGQDGRPYFIYKNINTMKRNELLIPVMEQSHRINVFHFLKHRAPMLQSHWVWHSTRNVPDEVADSAMSEILDDPEEWLFRRPFMQALLRAIIREGSIDMELLELPSGFTVDSEGEVESQKSP